MTHRAFALILLFVATALGGAAYFLWPRRDSPDVPTPPEPPPPALTFGPARPDPEMNALFERPDGWIGGDGAYAVALTPQRTLWLFSDTWVGKVRDGQRIDPAMVYNTVGVQAGRGPGAKIEYFIRRGADGKPAPLFTPADGRGWFWPQAAVAAGGRLLVVLTRMEKAGDGGALGFREVDRWLAVVANPLDAPTEWRVASRPLPFTHYTPTRAIGFGAAARVEGEDLYIYGTDEDIKPGGKDRYLTVARVPLAKVEDFAAWRFYNRGEWVASFRDAERVASNVGSEGSVTYHPRFKRYVLVYTENGFSDKIHARLAPTPCGPWSPPAVLYTCPEMGWHKDIFTYGAKAQPSQADGDELVICYFANSFHLWRPLKDARLYWPRFVRVKLGAE